MAVIPAYNEELTIGSIVLCAKKHVDKVLVIDDGSRDRTGKLAELAGATVIRHDRNMGKGAALKTAFEYAIGTKVDILVCLDADGQHDPDDIPKLLQPLLLKRADVVLGSRFIEEGNKSNVPKGRRVGQKVLDIVTTAGTKLKVTDTQSGFRAYARRTFDKFSFKERGICTESEMLIDAIENGMKVLEVPISCQYNIPNPSKEGQYRHGMRVFNFALRSIRERHPLLFFGGGGFIALLVGLAFGLYTIDYYLQYRFVPFGPALITIALTLAGMFSIFAGLMLNAMYAMIQRITGK